MSNFTLIIPTHNRHNYLKRSVSYFKDLDAKVIYCDSSEEKFEGTLGANMTYLHLPAKQFANKILEALQVVNTPFVALCADDDFILIDSLYQAASILANEKEFKTVVGKYIAFKELFDGNYYHLYQKLPQNINESPQENVELFFSNYYQILWAMYDKKVIINAFQVINNAKLHNDNYIEIIVGSFACYFGGIKFLNKIWGVRELSTEVHWGKMHTPISSVKIARIQGDYEKFQYLVDKNTFTGCAEIVMSNYLRYQMSSNGFFKFWISKIIPKIYIIKNILKYFHKSSGGRSLDLSQSQINYLSPITNILTDYNLSNVK